MKFCDFRLNKITFHFAKVSAKDRVNFFNFSILLLQWYLHYIQCGAEYWNFKEKEIQKNVVSLSFFLSMLGKHFCFCTIAQLADKIKVLIAIPDLVCKTMCGGWFYLSAMGFAPTCFNFLLSSICAILRNNARECPPLLLSYSK